MNGFEEHYRQMLREEIAAAVGEELRAMREELAELRNGIPPELRGLLTLDQVADYLGVKSSQTARAWCHKNKIKLRKVGSGTRILGEDVYNAIKRK